MDADSAYVLFCSAMMPTYKDLESRYVDLTNGRQEPFVLLVNAATRDHIEKMLGEISGRHIPFRLFNAAHVAIKPSLADGEFEFLLREYGTQ